MNRKITEIQVLRALAVLMVIAHHVYMNLITWHSTLLEKVDIYFGGNAGVDLFFVISGFVVAQSFLSNLENTEQPQLTLLEFWIKRVFRIIPSAWFWLLATLLLAIFFNQSGAFGSVQSAVEGSLAAVLQVANVRFSDCFLQFECGPNFVYWSLSLEEQFYLILPVLALLSKRRLPLVLLLFVFSQPCIPWLMLPTTFRMTGFALGVLMACYVASDGYRSLEPIVLQKHEWLRRTTVALLLGLLCAVTANGAQVVTRNFGFNLVALLSAALVFIASFDRQYILRNGWLKQLLTRIGDRSYALYLTHIPAFFATRELFHRFASDLANGPTAMLAYLGCAFALTFAFSEFSYRLIEVPLQRRGAQWLALRRQQEFAHPNGINHAQQTT